MAPKNIKKTSLTEDQNAILNDRLDDFNDAPNGRTKKETIARRLAIREQATEALWKINPSQSNRTKDELEKCIGSWFNNHKTVEDATTTTTRRVWKGREVFLQDLDWKEKIRDEAARLSNCPPGTPKFLAAFQPALKSLWESQFSTAQAAYERTAAEWSAKTLPRDVQLRQLKKLGDKPIREFAQRMFKDLGTRVFVLSATKNGEDDVVVSWHDFNEDLGYEGFPTAETGWNSGPVFDAWTSYAQDALGKCLPAFTEVYRDLPPIIDGEVPELHAKEKATISDIELELDGNGLPIVPDVLPTSRPDLDSMVRQFVTAYYRVASGKPKVKVPWKSIARNPDDFIDSTVMPEGFTLMDPSKFHVKDCVMLLNHWEKVGFQFNCYETAGKMETAEEQIPEKVKGKGKAKGRGQVTSTREKPVAKLRKSGKVSTARPATRGGQARLKSGERDSPDAEDRPEDDIQEELPAKQGAGPSKAAPAKPRNIGATARGTKSTNNPDRSQMKYLHSLSTRSEYRELVRVVYATPLGRMSIQSVLFPPFADWNYDDPFLPDYLHLDASKMEMVLAWLEKRPYLDKAGEYLGRSIGDRVTLAVGLLIKDITAIQFVGEDEDDVENIPEFFEDSLLQFTVVDDILLPFCSQMITDITVPSPNASPSAKTAPKASSNRQQPITAKEDNRIGDTAIEDNRIGDTAKQTAGSPDRPLAEESRSSVKARKGKVVTTSPQDPEEDPAVAEVKQQKAGSKKAAVGLNTTGDTAQRSQPPGGSKVASAEVSSKPTGTKRNLHSDSGENSGEEGNDDDGRDGGEEASPAKTRGKRNAPGGIMERSQPTRDAKTQHSQVGVERKDPKKKGEKKTPAAKQPGKKRSRQ